MKSLLRKPLAMLWLALLATPFAAASVLVSGSLVQNQYGVPLASGQWCFSSTCLTVTNGAFSGSVTAGTQTVTVKNGSSTILSVSSVTISGSTYDWDLYTVPYGATFTGDGAPYLACQQAATYTQLDSTPVANQPWKCNLVAGMLTWQAQQVNAPVGPGFISGLGAPTVPPALAAVVPTLYFATDTNTFYVAEGATGAVSTTWISAGGTGSGCPTTGCVYTGAISGPQADFGNLSAVLIAGTTAYPTISSAVAEAETLGGAVIWIPCGTYTDTITISGSNITLEGQGMQCTTIKPSSNSPVLTFAAGSTGLGINYNTVRDLSISNPSSGGSTGDAVQFTGGTNIPNDRTTFERVAINGFSSGNGVNFIGRAIWDRFIDVYLQNNYYGYYKSSAGVVNRLTVEGGMVNGNIRGGVYWLSTNPDLDIDLTFHDADIEYNGTGTAGGGGSTAYANCAGMYMNGVGVVSVEGTSYFEGNCTASTGTYNGADIRIDGTYAQQFNVTNSMLWSVTAYGIYNTATETTGTYTGDRITFHTTAAIKVAAATDSNVTIGGNFYEGAVVQEIPDGDTNNHMSGFAPFIDNEGGAAISGNTINPITGGVLNPLIYDHIVVYNGPFTITNITGTIPGRILKITPQGTSVNNIVLSTAGTGTNALYLAGGATTQTLPVNETATFYYSATFGKWMETSSSIGAGGGGSYPTTGYYGLSNGTGWATSNLDDGVTTPGTITSTEPMSVDGLPISSPGGGTNANVGGALPSATTGGSDTAVGVGSLEANTTASANTAVGEDAAGSTTSGGENTVMGFHALYASQTGTDNVAIGFQAGSNSANPLTGGVYIGWDAYPGGSSDVDETVIGAAAVGHGSYTTTIGTSNTTTAYLFGTLQLPGSGSAPTVSSNAGTGSLTHGTDNAGIIATGSSSTATTLTFNVGWGTWASCTVSANTSTALPYVSAISNSAVTFTYVTTGTPTLYYHCNGN